MTYHVGIFEASDLYEDRYGDCRLVVIWQSEKGAVFNTSIGSVVPQGTSMKLCVPSANEQPLFLVST